MRAAALWALWALGCGCGPDHSRETPAGPSSAPASLSPPAPPAASSGAPAALTPQQEAEARRVVVDDCLACHAREMLEQQRLTHRQWAAVVAKMQGWGSQVEAGSVDVLVAHLSARYGTSAPPLEPREIRATDAADAIARTPDGPFAGGDASKGARLYEEACASCHGQGAEGAATGVRLADRPGLYRAGDFAEVVRRGRGRMPAFEAYGDADVAALLAFLRAAGR